MANIVYTVSENLLLVCIEMPLAKPLSSTLFPRMTRNSEITIFKNPAESELLSSESGSGQPSDDNGLSDDCPVTCLSQRGFSAFDI